ncbi:PAS domain S-box-containing protein [Desulfobotulus alkaliphilus]|uniref:Sensory/regulatory protein RpfC n=1 Tax=Desulfobotulus alkaliphilus TaxID=622671 RepID=A0A562RMR3_9BACT|nr:ATP-binding protein [Desulfobotulus alkaliphilus]TWI70312.1 PAS domain S-box-containing protein [Desulfobotulus alkaliphilus]
MMIRIRRLRTRINLAIALTFIVIAIFSSVCLCFYETQRRADYVMRLAGFLEDLLYKHNDQLSNEVFSGLTKAAQATLFQISERQDVLSVLVFDGEGRFFTGTGSFLPSPLTAGETAFLLNGPDYIVSKEDGLLKLTYTGVLKAHGLHVGFCRIEYSLGSLQRETETIVLIFTVALVSLFCVMSGLLNLMLSRMVVRPLRTLKDSMGCIGEDPGADNAAELLNQLSSALEAGGRDFEDILKSRDETGSLARAFRRMLVYLRQACADLSIAEEKYRGIFENAAEGIFQVTPDGHIQTVNPAVLNIFGFSSREELIKVAEKFGSGCFAKPKAWDSFLGELKAKGRVRDFHVKLRKRNGKNVWVRINAHHLISSDGPLIEGVIQDITERVEKEKVQRELEVAEAATRAKSAFLASMSHEIRTPMNIVLGLTHLALKTELTDQQRDYLGKIRTAAANLLGIINDILDFSKIESGHLDFEEIPFDLHSVLKDLKDLHADKSAEKGIDFEVSCPSLIPRYLKGDPLRLGQVLTNLTGNALKFTKRGHVRVIVDCGEDDGISVVLCFMVQDTGVGITDEQLKGLFTPFVQADVSTTRQFGGSGLGLSISKSLVERMGGEIGVSSRPGQGSEFFFTARFEKLDEPVDSVFDHRPSRAETAALSECVDGLTGYVLLAEDNPVNQQIAKEILESFGLTPVVVENGHDAVEKVREKAFDLVLMDIQMPGMDGYEASRMIRNMEKEGKLCVTTERPLPIIAMTAHAMAGDREKSMAAGMDDHISKPIDFDELYGILVRWLPENSLAESMGILKKRKNGDLLSENDSSEELLPEHLSGFDMTAGLSRVMGDKALYHSFLKYFYDEYQYALEDADKALADGDLQRISVLLHNIKGVAGNLGGDELFSSIRNLEKILRSAPEYGDKDLKQAMEHFRKIFQQTMDALEKI